MFCIIYILCRQISAGKLLKFMRQGETTTSDNRSESVLGGGLSLEEGYLS